jgi:C4-dicarboxylate transporter, DctM subunit
VCAVFGACSGSSLASAATVGSIVMPTMKKMGYKKEILYGSLAGGGTLSSMIPPSIAFIFYGALVGESIGALLIAGVFPGILLAILFMGYIAVYSLIRPPSIIVAEKKTLSGKEIIQLALNIIPVIFIIMAVLGTIYMGIATPTEAAALGASTAIIVCALYGKLRWEPVKEAAFSTLGTCSMVFLILVGAMAFSTVLSMLKIPEILSTWVVSLELRRLSVFIAIVALYCFLGAIIDPNSMYLMTLPVTYPLMMALGFDSIWFGVCMAAFVEMAAVTPPLGLNLFVIHNISKEESIKPIILGSFPFFLLMLLLIALLYLFPSLATWLPAQIMQ